MCAGFVEMCGEFVDGREERGVVRVDCLKRHAAVLRHPPLKGRRHGSILERTDVDLRHRGEAGAELEWRAERSRGLGTDVRVGLLDDLGRAAAIEGFGGNGRSRVRKRGEAGLSAGEPSFSISPNPGLARNTQARETRSALGWRRVRR